MVDEDVASFSYDAPLNPPPPPFSLTHYPPILVIILTIKHTPHLPSNITHIQTLKLRSFGPEIWDNTNRIEAKIYCDGKALSPRQKPWT